MSLDTLIKRGAHLFQLKSEGARELFDDYEAGHEDWWMNIGRNKDKINLDDLVFVWVSGPSDKAGIVGLGIATGEFEDLEHPRSYDDPDGPRTLRRSAQVMWAWVGDTPVVTRAELKELDLFADFDLFKMPYRANAFEVTPEQTGYLVDRLKEVLG